MADRRLATLHKVSQSFVGAGTWRKEYRMLPSSLRFIRTHYWGPAKFFCFGVRLLQLIATLIQQLPDMPNLKLLKDGVVEGMKN
jgi:hypothetical protein